RRANMLAVLYNNHGHRLIQALAAAVWCTERLRGRPEGPSVPLPGGKVAAAVAQVTFSHELASSTPFATALPERGKVAGRTDQQQAIAHKITGPVNEGPSRLRGKER